MFALIRSRDELYVQIIILIAPYALYVDIFQAACEGRGHRPLKKKTSFASRRAVRLL